MSVATFEQFARSIAQALAMLLLTSLVATALIASIAWLIDRSRHPAQPTGVGLLGAFTLLGMVGGVIAGASQEGLVSAFLTGMLTIVSSLLAYAFTKDGPKGFREQLPPLMAVLLIAALTGLVIGAAYRAFHDDFERNYTSFRARFDQVAIPVEREKRLEILKACLRSKHTPAEMEHC